MQKTGGRAAGTPNKSSLAVLRKCEELGFDPIKEFIEKLKDIDSREKQADLILRFMEFVHPKRRPVDENGDTEGPPQIGIAVGQVSMSEEQIQKLVMIARGEK